MGCKKPDCSCFDRAIEKCGGSPEKFKRYCLNLLMGIQHVLAMMGSNVLVPLITGLSPSIAIFSAGLCTVCFHFIAQRKVPTFLGSSFSFVSAMQQNQNKYCDPQTKVVLDYDLRNKVYAGQQVAVIMTGVLYCLYSLIVYFVGPTRVKKIFPPIVVGPVIMVIGLTLAPSVINSYIVAQYTSTDDSPAPMKGYVVWIIVVITALIILVVSTVARGIWTSFPVLFGIIGGYIVSACFQVIDYSKITKAYWILFEPDCLKETFSFYKKMNWDWNSIAMICPISIVTFMEHLGDITTNGAVVGKNFFEDPGLHFTLLGDGIALMIAGFLGGPAITTYGENTGVLAITKNYNPKIILLAGIIAIIIGLLTKIGGVITSIPGPVIGGASMIMFGIIATMGMKVLIINQVNITKAKNMMIAALIVTIGLGFTAGGVQIVIEDITISPLAVCTIVGVLLNLILPESKDDDDDDDLDEEKKELDDSELSEAEARYDQEDSANEDETTNQEQRDVNDSEGL